MKLAAAKLPILTKFATRFAQEKMYEGSGTARPRRRRARRARSATSTDQLFRLRIQKSMGQLEAPDKMRTVRRDLARVKTVLRQKQAK